MYCSKCGAAIATDVAFCPKCGQRVQITGDRQVIEQNDRSAPTVAAGTMTTGNHEEGMGVVAPSSSSQDARMYDASNYPGRGQYQIQQQAPSTRKSKKPFIIGGVIFAIVACLAVIAVVMFGQNFFGHGEKAYVLSEMKSHFEYEGGTGSDDVRAYTRDEHGNLTKLDCTRNGLASYSEEYAVDENGYATSFAYANETTQEHYSGTCQNVVDEKGRLLQSVISTSTGTSITARYNYYDETYKVKSVTYSDINDSDSESGTTTLATVAPPQFDPVAMTQIIRSGGGWFQGAPENTVTAVNSLTCHYSEGGILVSVEKNGIPTDYATELTDTREQRKGKTVTSQTGTSSVETTYDEQGNPVYMKISGGEGAPHTETIDRSYVEVASPSKAVLIFECGIDPYR